MVVELRTLRVSSEFDAGRYVAGMDAKVAADRRGAESSKATGTAVEEQKIRVSSMVPLLERLSRTYIDGYGTAAKFNAEILRLAKSQDTAGASTLHLEKIYQGMQSRFGMTANATELAALGYTGLATAIANVNGRLSQNELLAQRAANAQQRLVAANRNSPGAGYTSNIAAQLQDVAVTAQYGNPIQVALQQGTQLSAVLNDLRRDGVSTGAALAGAFTSILNPVSLLTLGVIAGGVALYQYATSGSDSVEKLNEKLKTQETLIQTVGRRWGDAYPALKSYADELERAANSSQLQEAQAAAAERRFRELMGTLDGLAKRAPEISRALRDITSPEGVAANQTYLTAMTEIRAAVEAGRDPTDALGRATGALSTIMQETGSAAVRSYAEQFDFLAERIRGASDQARSFRMQLPDLGTLSPLWSEGGKLYSGDDFKPRGNAPTPDRRPLIEIEGLPGEAKQNEALGRSYRDIFKSAQDRIEQVKIEATVSGQSGIAAQRLRFELELLQDAQDKGRKITPAQREEIEKLGQAYEVAARQAASLKLQADAAFEREQLGRSSADQRIANQLRGAGLPIDLSSYEAGILRANEALKQQVATWEEIRNIGRDAIDQITGSALKGFDNVEDVLKNVAESMLKQLTQLSIANPLKNAIYGDQLPTLDSVGGVGGMFGALLGGQNPAAARNATAMTVNAASVVINGSVTGGIGNVLNGLGGTAANENNPIMAGTMSQFARAIKSIESGGRYDALGPITRNGDRAHGAYQVMGANIGPWSRAALGRSLSTQEFLANPRFQDQIFSHRFGGYVGKYGPSGAAQAWFGGPGSVGGSGNQADLLGTTGTEYVNKFNDALGRVTSSTDTAAQGLGTFGGGLGAFGDILSQAVGGGAGGGSFLENFFMTFLKSFSQNLNGYAGGTESAAPGWAWVGERGPELMRMRGGEVVRNHAASVAMAGGGRTVVNRQVIINNAPPGYHAEVQEEDDGNGNEKVNVTFSKLAAKEAGRPGSPLNKQLRGMGARGQRRRM